MGLWSFRSWYEKEYNKGKLGILPWHKLYYNLERTQNVCLNYFDWFYKKFYKFMVKYFCMLIMWLPFQFEWKISELRDKLSTCYVGRTFPNLHDWSQELEWWSGNIIVDVHLLLLQFVFLFEICDCRRVTWVQTMI